MRAKDLDGISSIRSQLNSHPERVLKKEANITPHPLTLSPEHSSVGHGGLSHFADLCFLFMSHTKMAAGGRGKYNVNGFQTPLEKKTSRIAQGKREREAKRSGL